MSFMTDYDRRELFTIDNNNITVKVRDLKNTIKTGS